MVTFLGLGLECLAITSQGQVERDVGNVCSRVIEATTDALDRTMCKGIASAPVQLIGQLLNMIDSNLERCCSSERVALLRFIARISFGFHSTCNAKVSFFNFLANVFLRRRRVDHFVMLLSSIPVEAVQQKDDVVEFAYLAMLYNHVLEYAIINKRLHQDPICAFVNTVSESIDRSGFALDRENPFLTSLLTPFQASYPPLQYKFSCTILVAQNKN